MWVKIGQAAQHFGRSTQTLRLWAQRGLVPTRREPGGQTSYEIPDDSFVAQQVGLRRKLGLEGPKIPFVQCQWLEDLPQGGTERCERGAVWYSPTFNTLLWRPLRGNEEPLESSVSCCDQCKGKVEELSRA